MIVMQIDTKFNIDDVVYVVGSYDMATFNKECDLCHGKEILVALVDGQKKEVDCSCKHASHSRSIFYNDVRKMTVREIKILVDWRKKAELVYDLSDDEDSTTIEEEYIFKTECEALEFCVCQNENIVKNAEKKGYYLKKVDKEKMNNILIALQKIELGKEEKQ